MSMFRVSKNSDPADQQCKIVAEILESSWTSHRVMDGRTKPISFNQKCQYNIIWLMDYI